MKILIIRFSSIGDIVLTTPVVRCLKLQTSATIHYLTKRNFKGILAQNPYIDKTYSIDKEVVELKNELKAEQYDLIIDLHNNLRSRRLSRMLGVKAIRFEKLNIQKWLLVNLGINRLPNLHIVDRYMATVASLNVVNDQAGLDYFMPESDRVDVKNILGISAPYIAFVIGAAHATKRLTDAKIIEICKQIQQPIVLIGGKEERDIGEHIAQDSGAHVINTCGQLSLNQSASVVQQSAHVIAHDTGLMHIAAAFRKPITLVWGNTIPAFGMYPYLPNNSPLHHNVEVKNLSCRPCSKIGFQQCPKGHFRCMQDIDVAEVVRTVVN